MTDFPVVPPHLRARDYFSRRPAAPWLICPGGDRLTSQVHHYLQEIAAFPATPHPTLFLAEPDPVDFLAGFVAACMEGCPVFLCNPTWTNSEWRQVFSQAHPDLIWGAVRGKAMGEKPPHPCPPPHPETIMIPTGGSSGQVRFTVHTWGSLLASVQGFRTYFQLETQAVHSFCVLPLYHVSGLMQFLRSFTSGGTLVVRAFKPLSLDLAAGNGMGIQGENGMDPAEFFISLVPTQLQRLIGLTSQAPSIPLWLAQFQTILLGGGPAWPELLVQARHHRLNLALTYGMTETASQIVTLKPQDFLAGNNSCGQVLPHAQVTIQDRAGRRLPPDQVGHLSIQAKSQALGYFPDHPLNKPFPPQPHTQGDPTSTPGSPFSPDDMGFLDAAGYLHIVGRNSDKIISGGENVFPAEVEAVIRATGLVQDICVLGLPHPHWGEAVTAVYVPIQGGLRLDTAELQRAIAPQLSRYKQPKRWVAIEQLPRNDQGKINHDRLRAQLKPHPTGNDSH